MAQEGLYVVRYRIRKLRTCEKKRGSVRSPMFIAQRTFFLNQALLGAKCYDAPKGAQENGKDLGAINMARLTALRAVSI
jgi:hypothetical protein